MIARPRRVIVCAFVKSAAIVAIIVLGSAAVARAQYTVLHNFLGPDGAAPGGLIQATDGNFYGTTVLGGAIGAGAAFRMTPAGVVTVLHSFGGGTLDGANPNGGLIQATDGNF